MSDRIQKKCFLGSSLMHVGVILIVLIGSAFSKPRPEPPPPAVMVTLSGDVPVTDGPSNAGSAPQPRTEEKSQVTSQPPAVTPPQREPEKIEPVTPPKHVKTSVPKPAPAPKIQEELPPVGDFTFKDTKKTKPAPKEKKFNLTDAVDITDTKKQAKEDAEKQKREDRLEQERLYRETREKQANVIKRFRESYSATSSGMASAMSSKWSPSGVIVQVGANGTGDSEGPASANYRDHVFTAYYRAWAPPESVSGNPTVEVRIVVQQDGRITSAEIVTPSGNSSMNDSVNRALLRVPTLPAFPSGSRDTQRTYNIIFDISKK